MRLAALVAVAAVAFYACSAPALPPEGPLVMTVSCAARDAGR